MDTFSAAHNQDSRLCKLIIPVLSFFAVLASVFALHASGGVYFPGDVNADKEIDVSDAVLLARLCAADSGAVVSQQGKINADANNDQKIDSSDCIHILKMIAGLIPMPQNPYLTTETTPGTCLTTTSETDSSPISAETTTEVTETSETAAVSEESTTISVTELSDRTGFLLMTETTAEETAVVPEEQELMLNGQSYPLGVSISVLTGQKMPNETLTVGFESGNIIFAIFADDPANTTIAIAYQDNIVGYYKFCSEYTVPTGYKVTEYRDKLPSQDGPLYAVTILRHDVSIRFGTSASREDLGVFSKLNYYAVNGVRAINNLPPLIWYPELVNLAQAHSSDMAVNNYFEHVNSEGIAMKERVLNAGIDYMMCGENIDRGQYDPFNALDGWYCSGSHRNNLLSTGFTHIGIGFAYNPDPDSDQCFYGTQDFCAFFP